MLVVAGLTLAAACAAPNAADPVDEVATSPRAVFDAREILAFESDQDLRVALPFAGGTLSVVVLDAAEETPLGPGTPVAMPHSVVVAASDITRYTVITRDPVSGLRSLSEVGVDDAASLLMDQATPSICGDRMMIALGHGITPAGERIALMLGIGFTAAPVASASDGGEAGEGGEAGGSSSSGGGASSGGGGPSPGCTRSGNWWSGYSCGGDCGSIYLHCDFMLISWWQSPTCGCQNAGGIPG